MSPRPHDNHGRREDGELPEPADWRAWVDATAAQDAEIPRSIERSAGQDNISSSELRRHQRRVAELDRRIGESLFEIEPSIELSARVKAALKQAAPSAASMAEASQPGKAEPSVQLAENAEQSPITRPLHRRRWMQFTAAACLLVLVSSLAVAVAVWNRNDGLVSASRVAHQAMEWKRTTEDREWMSDPQSVQTHYPPSPDLLLHPQRWMKVSTQYDSKTVAYDLTLAGQPQAILFVARTSREFDLQRLMPVEPIYRTGSFCIGACHVEGTLYVLFVEGDERRYREILRPRIEPV